MRLTPSEQAYLAAAEAGDWTEVKRLAYQIDTDAAATEARLNAPGALGAAALWYAQNNIAVFPCRPGAKVPATRNGFHDSSTTPERIRTWWGRIPDANIGLPTGLRFDVIDVDGPEGTIALGEYKDAGRMPPVLAWARTPHGFHYLVPPAAGRGNKAGLLPGVDYRGTGGYIVAPPSRTADGVYRWVPAHELDPTTLPQEAAHG